MSEQAVTDMESEGQIGIDPASKGAENGGGSGDGAVSNGFAHQSPGESAPLGYNRDGSPKKSRAGRPRTADRPGLPVEDAAREEAGAKRARLSRVRPKPESEQAPTEDVSIADAVPVRVGVDHVALGTQAAYLFVVVGSLAFGQDFQPDMHPDGAFTQEGRTDFNAVRDSFGNYFKAAGIDKIDPGWALAIGLVAYTAKRAQKPSVKSRIGRAFDWCKSKVGGFGFFRGRSSST